MDTTLLTYPKQDRVYVAHREGELVDFTTILTFSLLQKIFGFRGPYRKALAQFGIGDPAMSGEYLTYIYGRVYSDIFEEERLLWQPSGFRIQVHNEAVKFSIMWGSFVHVPILYRFLHKLASEVFISAFPMRYLNSAIHHYSRFLEGTDTLLLEKKVTVYSFVQQYVHVVMVSYVYELLFRINNNAKLLTPTEELQEYIQKHDPFSGRNNRLPDLRFALNFPPKPHFSEPSIDRSLFFPKTKDPIRLRADAYLQILRNNLRLRVSHLLHETARGLAHRIDAYSLEYPDMLTIDEIETFPADKDLIKASIRERIAYFQEAKQYDLPTIISRGIIARKTPTAPMHKKVFEGIACSTGEARAELCIVHDNQQDVSGKIAVFPDASPYYTVQFHDASGLVFASGSPLSHGSIVARELGKPAVVIQDNVAGFDGEKAHLSGSEGILTVS